jgi:hypothetical protein
MSNAPTIYARTTNVLMWNARTIYARTIWLLTYELQASLLPV